MNSFVKLMQFYKTLDEIQRKKKERKLAQESLCTLLK